MAAKQPYKLPLSRVPGSLLQKSAMSSTPLVAPPLAPPCPTALWQENIPPSSMATANLADHEAHPAPQRVKTPSPESSPEISPVRGPLEKKPGKKPAAKNPAAKKRKAAAPREGDWTDWEVVTGCEFRHHFDGRIGVWRGQTGIRWYDRLHYHVSAACESAVKKGTLAARKALWASMTSALCL